MKLIIAVIEDQYTNEIIKTLMENKLRVTKLSSTGGFLKSGNTTLLIGVEDESVDEVVDIIESTCKTREITTSLLTVSMPGDTYIPYPLEVKVGGATIFILDVEKYVRL